MTVSITPTVQVGRGEKLLLIAGPCQIESRDHALKIAKFLSAQVATLPISLVYKSSFDKANRTSVKSQRGVGVDQGLKILEEVRSTFGIPVLTDVHSEEQATTAGKVVDVLQIPAFLCRQTDLLVAAGDTGKTINVKKGQFLHPADMQFVAEKIASTGNKNIMLCERGTCFGYRDLIMDPRNLIIMRETGYPVIFDATHSVQLPGGGGDRSLGQRQFVAPLARAAMAVGIDGIFMETHPDPDQALSDGPNMVPLSELPSLMRQLIAIAALG